VGGEGEGDGQEEAQPASVGVVNRSWRPGLKGGGTLLGHDEGQQELGHPFERVTEGDKKSS
jgi:hypothetical protein